MPLLDRRVVVNIQGEGFRDDIGVYHEGEIVAHPQWALVSSAGATDIEAESGTEGRAVATFLVRHAAELAAAAVANVGIIDEYAAVWNVESIALSDPRRRYIQLVGVRSY